MSRFSTLVVASLLLAGCVMDWEMPGPDAATLDSEVNPDANERDGAAHVPSEDAASDAAEPTKNAGGDPDEDAAVRGDAAIDDDPDAAVVTVDCLVGDTARCDEDESGAKIVGLTSEKGVCRFGERTCTEAGWGPCVGARGPSVRQCDSVEDNDCDGFPDNDSDRRDDTCTCWSAETKACTGESSNCPGLATCQNHQWGACDAPSTCSCVSGEQRSCSGGSNNCEGGTQVCVGSQWSTCNGAPAYCECVNGTQRSCSGGTNNCSGGTQTCVDGRWGACSGAPAFCECDAGMTAPCASIPNAGMCGTATCGENRQWDRSACASANACGSCLTLLATPGTACDGTDADQCMDGTWTCASGQVTCNDATLGSSETEVCDGLDNDCDGAPDNGPGMQCVRGTSSSCTFTNGSCSAPGTRSCNASCGFDACEVARETACNRKDDDCDGYPDRDLLTISNELTTLISYDGTVGYMNMARSPVDSAGDGSYLLVYRLTQASLQELYGLRLDKNGVVQGSVLPIATNLPAGSSLDEVHVAWAQSDWVVAYRRVDSSPAMHHAMTLRVSPTNGAISGHVAISSGSIEHVRLVGGSLPVALFHDRSVGLRAASLGASIVTKTLAVSTNQVFWGKSFISLIASGTTWGVWTPKETYTLSGSHSDELHYLELDAALNVTTDTVLDSSSGHIAISGLTYLPGSQRLVGSYTDIAGSKIWTASHAPDGSRLRAQSDLWAHSRIFAETDGTWSSFVGLNWMRYDAASDTLFDTVDVYPLTWNDAAWAQTPESADTRYVAVVAMSGTFFLMTYGCR